MKKLIKFTKYNWGYIPPLIMFIFFIVVGSILSLPLMWGFGVFCLTILITSLIITLKNYK